jgi:hypothetical protein
VEVLRKAGAPIQEEQPTAALSARLGEVQLVSTENTEALRAAGCQEDINGLFTDMKGVRLPPVMGTTTQEYIMLALGDAPTLAAILQGVAATETQPVIQTARLDFSIPIFDSERGTYKVGNRLSNITPQRSADTKWTAGRDGTIATMEALVGTVDSKLLEGIKDQSRTDYTWHKSLFRLYESSRTPMAQQATKKYEAATTAEPTEVENSTAPPHPMGDPPGSPSSSRGSSSGSSHTGSPDERGYGPSTDGKCRQGQPGPKDDVWVTSSSNRKHHPREHSSEGNRPPRT